MSSYKPVSQLLNVPGGLQPLLERANFLLTLTNLIRDAVDPVIAEHITLSNLRDDTVIISADSPAWLSNIRYLAPTLLQLLQQQPGLEKVRKIQFKVQPAVYHGEQAESLRRASLSTKGAQVLTEAASAIDDPELAAALRRLSTNTNHGSHGSHGSHGK